MTSHETELLLQSNRWKRCHVNNLAETFHHYDDEKSQHERISSLYLTWGDLETVFPNPEKIISFHIKLGLAEAPTPGYPVTFNVSISAVHENGPITGATFHYGLPPRHVGAKVPFELKEWLSKNWMELDINQVDDVFAASLSPESSTTRNSVVPEKRIHHRLLGYHFESKKPNQEDKNGVFFNFIKTNVQQIGSLIFHLGVDMNKYGHKEQFSFSPIIEASFEKNKLTDDALIAICRSGMRCIPGSNDNDDSAYYEYMKPCPPTCSADAL